MEHKIFEVHKNQGKNDHILLKHTNPEGQVQLKTKVKICPVDEVVAEVPRDACFSRLENWRKLLRADEEGNPRRVCVWYDKGEIFMISLLTRKGDELIWDSEPLEYNEDVWVPFYFSKRYEDV